MSDDKKHIVAKLLDSSMQRAGHFRASHEAVIPAGYPADDLTRPECWANLARRLKQFDRIDAMAEDGAYYAELLVLDVGAGWAKVKQLAIYDLHDEVVAGEASEPSVRVEFKGPQKKHCVIRNSDGTILREGIAAKVDALREAAEFERKLAA